MQNKLFYFNSIGMMSQPKFRKTGPVYLLRYICYSMEQQIKKQNAKFQCNVLK